MKTNKRTVADVYRSIKDKVQYSKIKKGGGGDKKKEKSEELSLDPVIH